MSTQVQLHVRTEEMHDEMLRSEGVIGGPMNQLLSSNDYFDEDAEIEHVLPTQEREANQ